MQSMGCLFVVSLKILLSECFNEAHQYRRDFGAGGGLDVVELTGKVRFLLQSQRMLMVISPL